MAALGQSSCRLYLERCHWVQWIHPFNGGGFSLVAVSSVGVGVGVGVGVCSLLSETGRRERRPRGGVKVRAFWQSFSRPTSVELEAITETEDLDRALAEEAPQAIVIDWMASWCRKCIYLKPKLEGLAAEYHPRVKFYFVDVNKVPQALVKRGNVTKLPTIQLWKDGEWKAEVIGGHEAWLVINEVREMIKKHL